MIAAILMTVLFATTTQGHQLRDICHAEDEQLNCKWVGAGLYTSESPIDQRKILFQRFFDMGLLDVTNRNIDFVEILAGTAKCRNIRVRPETIVYINGQQCMVSFCLYFFYIKGNSTER